MTKAKHTPGPWAMSGARSRFSSVPGNAQFHTVFQEPGGEAIAAIFYNPGTHEGFHDARLIAAAPELLDALKAAVASGMIPKSSAKEGGANKYSEQVYVADQIRAAIAKAEGEA